MYLGNAESMELVKREKITSLATAQNKDFFIYGSLIIAAIFAFTGILNTSKGSPRYSR